MLVDSSEMSCFTLYRNRNESQNTALLPLLWRSFATHSHFKLYNAISTAQRTDKGLSENYWHAFNKFSFVYQNKQG